MFQANAAGALGKTAAATKGLAAEAPEGQVAGLAGSKQNTLL